MKLFTHKMKEEWHQTTIAKVQVKAKDKAKQKQEGLLINITISSLTTLALFDWVYLIKLSGYEPQPLCDLIQTSSNQSTPFLVSLTNKSYTIGFPRTTALYWRLSQPNPPIFALNITQSVIE